MTDKKIDEDNAPGNPWAINSAEYGYCFWRMAEDLDGDPKTDKEICQLLTISQSTLDKVWANILLKLRSRKDDPDIQEWIELLRDRADSAHADDTIYVPHKFEAKLAEPVTDSEDELDADAKLAKEIQDMEDEKDKRYKRLKKSGMPLHRSNVRLDLYGITSKKTLERIRNEKNKK